MIYTSWHFLVDSPLQCWCTLSSQTSPNCCTWELTPVRLFSPSISPVFIPRTAAPEIKASDDTSLSRTWCGVAASKTPSSTNSRRKTCFPSITIWLCYALCPEWTSKEWQGRTREILSWEVSVWKSSEVNCCWEKSYMACISAQLHQKRVPVEGNGKYQKASTVMMSQENALK